MDGEKPERHDEKKANVTSSAAAESHKRQRHDHDHVAVGDSAPPASVSPKGPCK
jgi:hypothetical protein